MSAIRWSELILSHSASFSFFTTASSFFSSCSFDFLRLVSSLRTVLRIVFMSFWIALPTHYIAPHTALISVIQLIPEERAFCICCCFSSTACSLSIAAATSFSYSVSGFASRFISLISSLTSAVNASLHYYSQSLASGRIGCLAASHLMDPSSAIAALETGDKSKTLPELLGDFRRHRPPYWREELLWSYSTRYRV